MVGVMHLLTVFAAGFLSVFFAAFQSRCVNSGDHWLATANSFFIGIGSAFVWRAVTEAGAGWPEILAYSTSGAVAVNCAMWAHNWMKRHQAQRLTDAWAISNLKERWRK
jgi:hypothetical protein